MPPRKPKKARWCRVKNERNTSHPQVPATPNSFPTFEPAVSEHGGVLIPNIPILCDDVVRRIDVGVQTISDWCNTESIPSGVDVSIQTESHCVCRCDSHVVHHVSNTDSNTYNDRLEECQHHSYDEEYLPLRDMEVHDNQAGSCTQDDAILSDPDFSYESQADDTMSFSSIANSPPTGFAVPEVCAIACKQCKVLKEDNAKLLIKIDVLTLSEDAFAHDDEKVKFYTGLPNYGTLKRVVTLVSHQIEKRSKLSTFQQILLILMKLRLDLPQQDLAYRFGISQSAVSKLFNAWICIMAKRLECFIIWPNKLELTTSLPNVFRKFYEKCTCIIDCTEIFIERPSNLLTRAQTWSNYKQHNTIKVLIAITPQGTISFISQAWGGRASDKFITEHSGFLDVLSPGDLVLADRGFTIEESVGLYCAKVCIPPFTKGRKQLTRHEVDWSREISHVRVHVERVIGQLKKKYTLLQGVIPITLLKNKANGICTLDCIITVCSALCNMCPSVVPFD